MGSQTPLIVLVFSVMAAVSIAQTPPRFNCSSTAKCRSLIDYLPQNATTIAEVERLFQVKHLLSLLGANDLPSDTPTNFSLPASRKVKIPIHCKCGNGTGHSDGHPIYKVRSGDSLDVIAEIIFGRLVTFEQIAAANGIPDPNKITAGQELLIPLPCSCDEVEGNKVVHYGHLVESGSSVAAIAETYNVSEQIILKLNGIADAKDLQASQVLDIPLQACSSVIRNDSLDYPFLISNGTYDYTANNCVMCKCRAANNMILECNPSQMKPSHQNSSNSSSCPSMLCEGGSLLGNSTSSGCITNTCAYAGYSGKTIFTNISSLSTCPEPPSSDSSSLQALSWNWNFIFGCMHVLGFGFLLI